MIDTDFLNSLDRLHLIIKKKITSSYSGSRESPSFGRGLSFRDHREYVPGDDFRAIDWNVYARTTEFFIKRYEEERNLTVHVIVDSSASMNFGRHMKKFDYGSMIGVGFAYMAMKNNERFVFSTFSDKLNPFRAKKGTKQLLNTVSYLNLLKVQGVSNFKDSLRKYKKLINSKSLIIIISDFLFDLEELKESLLHYKRNQLIIVQVLDPIERDLEFYGNLVLHDSETASVLHTFVSRRVRDNYKKKLEDHILDIKELCDRIGAEFITVTTDKPIFDTFYEILR
ncbi:DUF58 domain-containing protein [Candidatus Woesearchaeota archaeon]|nr:DUF58 domain-containing protein [Candidatus Woesearchaeota archaeon]